MGRPARDPSGRKAALAASRLFIPSWMPFRVSFGDPKATKDVCEFLTLPPPPPCTPRRKREGI